MTSLSYRGGGRRERSLRLRVAAHRAAAARCRGPPARRAAHRQVRPAPRRGNVLGLVRRGPRGDDPARRPHARRPGHAADHVELDPRGLLPARRGAARRPAVDGVRHARHLRRVADPRVLARLHGARPRQAALLRLPQPVRRVDAPARARRLLPAAVRRLGGRGPGLVPAHRLLELEPRLRDRGQQGLLRQPGRRPRPRHRDHADVRHLRWRRLRDGRRGRGHRQPGGDHGDGSAAARGGVRQVGPVPAAVVAR